MFSYSLLLRQQSGLFNKSIESPSGHCTETMRAEL